MLIASSEPCIGTDSQIAPASRENHSFYAGRADLLPVWDVMERLKAPARENPIAQCRPTRQSCPQSASSWGFSGKCQFNIFDLPEGFHEMLIHRNRFVLSLVATIWFGMSASLAEAQMKYGPWVKQDRTCRPLEVRNTFGQTLVSPQISIPGKKSAETCDYCREVVDCPRLRDKIANPKQCFQKKQCKPGLLSGSPED